MTKRSKRINGDGSVYKKGSGYEAAITVNGKYRTKRAPTKAEAEAALRLLRAQRDTGTLPRPTGTTTGEFLAYWIEQRKPFLRYSTWRRYSENALGKAAPALGAIPLTRLTALHLDDLYSKCLGTGLAPRSVLHLHRVLHKALADAEAWDLVDRNVARKASPPRVQEVPPQVLQPAEVARLLAAGLDHPLGTHFIVSVTTGVRRGELLGLRWSDVDLTQGTASIRQTLQRAATGFTFGPPKTAKGVRDVELLAVAREALVAHRRQQNVQRLAAGGSWANPDLVFTDPQGQPLNPERLSRQFRSLMKDLGMTQVPLKNLRHTFATLHLDTGVSDLTLSQAMGHSRPSTTNTYYRRVDRRHQQAAAGRLEALLHDAAETGVTGSVTGSGPAAAVDGAVG